MIAIDEDLRHADALRNQVGKTVAELRTLNDAAEFKLGRDRQHQTDTSRIILRAAFAAAAMFWNELAFLRNTEDKELLHESGLIEMRRGLAAELNRMSESMANEDTYGPATVSSLLRPDILEQSRYSDHVQNTRDHFYELASVISGLNTPSRWLGLPLLRWLSLQMLYMVPVGSDAQPWEKTEWTQLMMWS